MRGRKRKVQSDFEPIGWVSSSEDEDVNVQLQPQHNQEPYRAPHQELDEPQAVYLAQQLNQEWDAIQVPENFRHEQQHQQDVWNSPTNQQRQQQQHHDWDGQQQYQQPPQDWDGLQIPQQLQQPEQDHNSNPVQEDSDFEQQERELLQDFQLFNSDSEG